MAVLDRREEAAKKPSVGNLLLFVMPTRLCKVVGGRRTPIYLSRYEFSTERNT